MWRTIGHDRAVRILQRSLVDGRVSHAYLITGPHQVGKMRLASDLAAALNCLEDDKPCGACSQCSRVIRGLHADIHVVGLASSVAENGRARVAIGIDQVREVQREASLTPYEGRSRVFIIDGAEHLSEEASNSLLKTLEEPPDRVVLLLLATEASLLLPTIVSRCQLLELRPVPMPAVSQFLESEYAADEADAEQIARLSEGRPGWAVSAVEDRSLLEELDKKLETIEKVVGGGQEDRFAYASALATSIVRDREAGRRELGLWLQWWRDILMVTEGVPDLVTHLSRIDTLKAAAAGLTPAGASWAINAVQDTLQHLERNVNPRLALESLMLDLPHSA